MVWALLDVLWHLTDVQDIDIFLLRLLVIFTKVKLLVHMNSNSLL